MEKQTIAKIADGFQHATTLLEQYGINGKLSLEDMQTLVGFYRDNNDTNGLIDYLQKHDTDISLRNECKSLLKNAKEFLNTYDKYASELESFSSKELCTEYLAGIYHLYLSEQEKSSALWKECNSIDWHYSLAEIDSEEYKHLEKLYEEKKAEHDAASKKASGLSQRYYDEGRRLADVYYFEMFYLQVMASRIVEIVSFADTESTEGGNYED